MTVTSPPLYINAPIAALVEGIFRADTTIADLKRHGDFGLGTFNDLDGEMVVLDGVVYQLRIEGEAGIVADDVLTPFACVTFFTGDTTEHFDRPQSAAAFERTLTDLLPTRNLVYAVRVEGVFDAVRARSVPRQDNYRPLAEVAASQRLFEFEAVTGTLVGFWSPSFLQSVHVPGFHLHFLTGDRRAGGHLLAAAPREVTVRIQHAASVNLGLPMTLDFLTADLLTRDIAADLHRVER